MSGRMASSRAREAARSGSAAEIHRGRVHGRICSRPPAGFKTRLIALLETDVGDEHAILEGEQDAGRAGICSS